MQRLGQFVKRKLDKMDVQVSLLTCALVIFSCVVIYMVTSKVMLTMLSDAYEERTDLTFQTIESHIDENVFRDDVSDSAYMAEVSYLSMVTNNMAISEIYITRKNYSDSIERVLDTSDISATAPKRIIETGIVADIVNDTYRFAYAKSGRFMHTSKGYRYIRFYPSITGGRNVRGVVAVTIDAQNVLTVKIVLNIMITILILICCLISIRFSKRIFKKISNPLYQDESNTDALTGLKNKNSYSVDMHNIETRFPERYGVIAIDLNGLKTINDTRGHQAGDLYIQRAAKILREALEGTGHIIYRIGGDEFSIFAKDVTVDGLKELSRKIDEKTLENQQKTGSNLTMSIGYAKFDEKEDRNFAQTIERADTMMYENKRMFYLKKNMEMR